MNCDVMVVTFKRDFVYLKYMLLSLKKFAKGFNNCRILVPHEDVDAALALVDQTDTREFPMFVIGYKERPEKGMLWHMRQIMYADQWCGADMIAHIDADCVFDSPISPADFLREDKIILRYEPFKSIGKRHEAVLRWQDCTQKILPFQVLHETMRGHPEVYHRSTYPLARELIEHKINIRFDDYLLSCQNEYPQSFCEHVTLGNVAMAKQPEKYFPVKQMDDTPTPDNKVFQAWSHGNIDQPQDLWYKGRQSTYVPIQMFERILKGGYEPNAAETERMAQ